MKTAGIVLLALLAAVCAATALVRQPKEAAA